MNSTDASQMAHQNPLHHHHHHHHHQPQPPLVESDETNHKINQSSLSSSSSSSTKEQSQEHRRLPVEASDLDKKQAVEHMTRLPSGASDSDRKQSVSSTEKQREEQLEHQERQEQEKQELQEHQEGDQGHGDDNGRERLKRHRKEVAGRVWIPEIWGQEDLLKDWIDCSTFDSCLVPSGISSARAALVEEARRASSNGGLRLENRCLILR